MLKKNNRISNTLLISKLHKQGKVYKTKTFVFKHLPSNFTDSKFAVSITKKVSSKAVCRNKTKRQLLECVEPLMKELEQPIVGLIIQKNGSPEKLKYKEVQIEVEKFFNHISSNV